ncbi:hypothetical protein ACWGOQ_0001770 [Aquimarina sp. M1]
MSFDQMKAQYKDAGYSGDKTTLREQMKHIQLLYPEKLSEAEPIKGE